MQDKMENKKEYLKTRKKEKHNIARQLTSRCEMSHLTC